MIHTPLKGIWISVMTFWLILSSVTSGYAGGGSYFVTPGTEPDELIITGEIGYQIYRWHNWILKIKHLYIWGWYYLSEALAFGIWHLLLCRFLLPYYPLQHKGNINTQFLNRPIPPHSSTLPGVSFLICLGFRLRMVSMWISVSIPNCSASTLDINVLDLMKV